MSNPPPLNGHKQPGCLKIGLWLLAGFLVIILIGGIVAFISLRVIMNNLRANYTETKPFEFKPEPMNASQKSRLAKSHGTLKKALENNKQVEVTIKGDDLTQFFANSPETGKFAKSTSMNIDGDVINAKMSFPLNHLNMKSFKGRYINGDFKIKLEIQNGILSVNIISCDVAGKPIPKIFLDGLNGQNWDKEMRKHYGNDWLRQIESLYIKDGNLHIKTKTVQK